MAYDKNLSARIWTIVASRPGYTEKKMFGGIGYLLRGHMCVGVWQDSLIARVGPDRYQAGLAQNHVKEFDVTGRPMRGWLLIEPSGIDRDSDLVDWINLAEEFVNTLPPKGP